MENASKALLMAGGILIAIIIIALLVKSFSSVSSFQKAKLTEEEQAQIIAFNEKYTKYVGQYVYGTEVLTLINKNDLKVTNENDELLNGEELKNSVENKTTTYYKCVGIEYDAITGIINQIKFKKINLSSTTNENT